MSAVTDFRDKLMAAPALQFSGGNALINSGANINLFHPKWPVSPDNAVQLSRPPTPGPERKMGTGTTGIVFYNIMVQVIVRSKTYATASAMMDSIIARMDNFVGLIGANDYHWVSLRSGPMDAGEDENGRFRISALFMMKGPVL